MMIFKKYFFDAAHFMPDFDDDHDYKKMHGHSYEVTVKLDGTFNNKENWVVDFELLDKSIKEIGLEELLAEYPKMLEGKTSGRYIINVNK